MGSLVQLIATGGIVLLVAFFGLLFWRIITAQMSLKGLLDGDFAVGQAWTTSFSPARGQLLMLTVFVAGYYVLQMINNPNQFPTLPDGLLQIFTGSSSLYLGSKAYAFRSGRPSGPGER